jgi:hypothetical protein
MPSDQLSSPALYYDSLSFDTNLPVVVFGQKASLQVKVTLPPVRTVNTGKIDQASGQVPVTIDIESPQKGSFILQNTPKELLEKETA